jgi:hypothetical protein
VTSASAERPRRAFEHPLGLADRVARDEQELLVRELVDPGREQLVLGRPARIEQVLRVLDLAAARGQRVLGDLHVALRLVDAEPRLRDAEAELLAHGALREGLGGGVETRGVEVQAVPAPREERELQHRLRV